MTEWRRRVLVVEDDALIAALLREVLTAASFEVAIASDVRQAKQQVRTFDPDLALLDISLGQGPTGLDLAFVIERQRPDIAILFLTQHPDPRTAGFDSLPMASAFIHKSMISDTDVLLRAIESALGDTPSDFRADLRADRPLRELTSAQLDVLRMASLGMTNAAITRARGTSERSVERLLAAAFQALGIPENPDINPRVEAIRRYIAAAGMPSWRDVAVSETAGGDSGEG